MRILWFKKGDVVSSPSKLFEGTAYLLAGRLPRTHAAALRYAFKKLRRKALRGGLVTYNLCLVNLTFGQKIWALT